MTAFEVARDASEHGFAVIPTHTVFGRLCSCGDRGCSSPGKHPRTARGVHEATSDERALLHWHERWPDSNWALACGERVAVLDIDSKAGADPREVIDEHE